MAKKSTKKSTLEKQYKQQLNRIKRGYRDIEIRGGSFSQSVSEIVGEKPKRISEGTIRRLKSISKESLYRLAKTDTGKSGYVILAERRSRAGQKGAFERRIHQEFKSTQAYLRNKEYYENKELYKQDYKQWRKEYFEELRVKHEDRLEEENKYLPPTEDIIEEYDTVIYLPEPEPEDYGEIDDTEFINIQVDNIYDTIDKIEDEYTAEFLKENISEAIFMGMDADEQMDFFTEHGGELMDAIEKEAKYKNAKDGDVRDNFFAANHFQNKALNIIWGGDIPLSAMQYRVLGD